MERKTVKVSAAAWEKLRDMAFVERRTIQAVVDGLVGVRVVETTAGGAVVEKNEKGARELRYEPEGGF